MCFNFEKLFRHLYQSTMANLRIKKARIVYQCRFSGALNFSHKTENHRSDRMSEKWAFGERSDESFSAFVGFITTSCNKAVHIFTNESDEKRINKRLTVPRMILQKACKRENRSRKLEEIKSFVFVKIQFKFSLLVIVRSWRQVGSRFFPPLEIL